MSKFTLKKVKAGVKGKAIKTLYFENEP